MIRGMTGFGRAAVSSSAGRVSVEIKSVNHRYFEFLAHLPPHCSLFEEGIRQELKKHIRRGRVTAVVNVVERLGAGVRINTGLAQTYLKRFKTLSRELNLKGDITLQQIVSLPGVISAGDASQSAEALWPAVSKAVSQAALQLVAMRQAEGKSISKDISRRLKEAERLVVALRQKARTIFAEKKKTIAGEELSVFLKEHDIAEELTRLSFHLESCEKLLRSSAPAGKELDFISQELQREINTAGAKLPHKDVSRAVVRIKALVEQIREQVQNVE